MAVHGSLSPKTSLRQTVKKLGFVQYDPIRRPARAQDLILRQRVEDYRIGDLDGRYPELGLEEDYLHVYGVMPRDVMHLLHPRPSRAGAAVYRPVGVTADVLAMVVESGPTHPRDARARFGARRTVNDWGGNSAVTTRALEELHYQGLLRVVRRENGTKIYEAVRARSQNVPVHERLERLTMLIARTLAPTPESSLRSAIGQLCHASGGFVEPQTAVADLMERGELRATLVDGVRYVWPRSMRVPTDSIEARQVRFLAPFDPVVWDRRRFAHLWGWQYRLEAYVPASKRQFGYYALPVLWGTDAVGWVNCERTPKGALSVEVGYTDAPIKTRAFRSALDTEIARLELMLGGRNEAPRRNPRT